jgi:uncharacterized RDD family membrane protein YckC
VLLFPLRYTADPQAVGQRNDMKYAGFRVRLAAGLIDFIIFIPLMFLYFWVESQSRTGTVFIVMPYYLFYAIYCIVFIGKYGQTPGKMVMKITVTRTDGTSIGYREALLRHSVEAIFGFVAGTGMLIAVLQTEPSVFNDQLTWIQRSQLIRYNSPSFASVADLLSNIWVYSELIVLFFNKKKRALHDFIAGTVVVHAQKFRVNSLLEADGRLTPPLPPPPHWGAPRGTS